jgi:hypothetical protein
LNAWILKLHRMRPFIEKKHHIPVNLHIEQKSLL